MDEIANKADDHAFAGLMIDTALALGAVEVLEGAPRLLARKRRRLADASQANNLVFAAWPNDFWGTIMERTAGD